LEEICSGACLVSDTEGLLDIEEWQVDVVLVLRAVGVALESCRSLLIPDAVADVEVVKTLIVANFCGEQV
jgi:hypothetical protein